MSVIDENMAASAKSAEAPIFLFRIREEIQRRRSTEVTLTTLQAESNRLLAADLLERQITFRRDSFLHEFRQYPSHFLLIPGLIRGFVTASACGDHAKSEWVRRKLEEVRCDLDDSHCLAGTCDLIIAHCDRVYPAALDALQTAWSTLDVAAKIRRIDTILAPGSTSHPSDFVAMYLHAAMEPEGIALVWVRKVLANLGEFPAAALKYLEWILSTSESS